MSAEIDHLSLVRAFSLVRAQSISKWTTALLSEHRRQFRLRQALTSDDLFPPVKADCECLFVRFPVLIQHLMKLRSTNCTQANRVRLQGKCYDLSVSLFYKCGQTVVKFSISGPGSTQNKDERCKPHRHLTPHFDIWARHSEEQTSALFI